MTYETMQNRATAEQIDVSNIPMEKRERTVRLLEEMLRCSHQKRKHILKMMVWLLIAMVLAVILEINTTDAEWLRNGIFSVFIVAQVFAFAVLCTDSLEAARWYVKLDAYAYPNPVPPRKEIERGESQTFLEDDLDDDENYALQP